MNNLITFRQDVWISARLKKVSIALEFSKNSNISEPSHILLTKQPKSVHAEKHLRSRQCSTIL